MQMKLNSWQKFWGLFAAVLLATSFALIGTLWPVHDPAVVADLSAPECREWRELPAGAIPPNISELGEECHALRSLLYRKHINLRTEADYDQYLRTTGIKNTGLTLAIWTGFVMVIYFLGWSSSRLVRTLRGKQGHKQGQKPDHREAT